MRLLPVISLMMNSQESSATGYSPNELFLGRPAWFLHAPYPEDTHSSVGEWVQEQQAKVDKAKAMLQRVRERQWNKKNKHRVPATYQEGDWVLVHHSRLPPWAQALLVCLRTLPMVWAHLPLRSLKQLLPVSR